VNEIRIFYARNLQEYYIPDYAQFYFIIWLKYCTILFYTWHGKKSAKKYAPFGSALFF